MLHKMIGFITYLDILTQVMNAMLPGTYNAAEQRVLGHKWFT